MGVCVRACVRVMSLSTVHLFSLLCLSLWLSLPLSQSLLVVGAACASATVDVAVATMSLPLFGCLPLIISCQSS